jgi:hypothetical protein
MEKERKREKENKTQQKISFFSYLSIVGESSLEKTVLNGTKIPKDTFLRRKIIRHRMCVSVNNIWEIIEIFQHLFTYSFIYFSNIY